MADTQNMKNDNIIDLREILLIIWANKLISLLFCFLGILCSAFIYLNTEVKYTSEAVFKISSDQTGLNISSELGALASLSGLSQNNKPSLPSDRINGRIFIQKLDKKLNLKEDVFFNKYNPNYSEPFWVSKIKNYLGKGKSELNVTEAIWQGIMYHYSKSIELEETDFGSMKVSATHTNAKRASEIANTIMQDILEYEKLKRSKLADDQVEFLANSLADALYELETSQSNLKKFTLENAALPLEAFTLNSLQLDQLREKLTKTLILVNAVQEIVKLLEKETTTNEDYNYLKKNFQIVDQVEFRRVLGQNEIISFWSWPEKKSAIAVLATLTERKKRLESEIRNMQVSAKNSEANLDSFVKMERELSIAEATYTVLIEQVKAQTLMAGYTPDDSEIYEYASPSVNPSTLPRNTILTIGALIGLFSGLIISIIFSLFKGVFYSKKSLIEAMGTNLNASFKFIKPANKLTLKSKMKIQRTLRNLTVEINKSAINKIIVTSSKTKVISFDVASALAEYIQSGDLKVGILNFSHNQKKLSSDTNEEGKFRIIENNNNVFYLIPNGLLNPMDWLSTPGFKKDLNNLSKKYDFLFFCADNENSIDILRALMSEKFFHITLARIRRTKKDTLTKMQSIAQAQGLLHD